jgi:hypothetical protein
MRRKIAAGKNAARGYRSNMIADKLDELLERHRALLSEMARKRGFELPPQVGGWEEIHAYEDRNAVAIQEADLLDEIDGILGHRA